MKLTRTTIRSWESPSSEPERPHPRGYSNVTFAEGFGASVISYYTVS
jgi:hypothetical protein